MGTEGLDILTTQGGCARLLGQSHVAGNFGFVRHGVTVSWEGAVDPPSLSLPDQSVQGSGQFISGSRLALHWSRDRICRSNGRQGIAHSHSNEGYCKSCRGMHMLLLISRETKCNLICVLLDTRTPEGKPTSAAQEYKTTS